MADKKETLIATSIFELKLTHDDILAMMNDPDVDLAGGVDDDQEFDVIFSRRGISTTSIGRMTPDDTILFRFRRKERTDETEHYDSIDVE